MALFHSCRYQNTPSDNCNKNETLYTCPTHVLAETRVVCPCASCARAVAGARQGGTTAHAEQASGHRVRVSAMLMLSTVSEPPQHTDTTSRNCLPPMGTRMPRWAWRAICAHGQMFGVSEIVTLCSTISDSSFSIELPYATIPWPPMSMRKRF